MYETLKPIFFVPGVYIYLPIWLLGFFCWAYMVTVSLSTFPKIKSEDKKLHAKIMGERRKSWLERGWFSPADSGIQLRLYRALYRREASQLLTRKAQTRFILATRVVVLAGIVWAGLFCLFWVFWVALVWEL